MKTNKFQDFLDIKRSELLDKISDGWTVRRKSWSVEHHSYGPLTVSVSMADLLCDDWEGHPPTPKLKRKLNKLYLEDVIVLTKDNPIWEAVLDVMKSTATYKQLNELRDAASNKYHEKKTTDDHDVMIKTLQKAGYTVVKGL